MPVVSFKHGINLINYKTAQVLFLRLIVLKT